MSTTNHPTQHAPVCMQTPHPCCTSKIWMYLQERDHTTGVYTLSYFLTVAQYLSLLR